MVEATEQLTDPFTEDLKGVYKTTEGRRMLTFLWNEYVVGTVTTDRPDFTYYQLGKRDLVLNLFRELNITNPCEATDD